MAGNRGSRPGSGFGITVVAIPAKDDRVWDLSSEKIPHLTLLFLGNALNNIERVAQHIEHTTSTVLSKFYLDVAERGVLGDQSADVLFFDRDHAKTLMEFRRSLLADTDISTAYNLTDQFPTWIPHLTMGYPTNPAKPDTRDYPGIHTVRFDRIALWTGDYEGREFPLKTANTTELAMATEKGKSFLEHYGIKGMRWGVRRDNNPTSGSISSGRSKAASVVEVGKVVAKEAYKPSKDAVKAQRYMSRAKLGGVRNLNNAEMQLVIQRMQLEKQYKELYGERQWTTAGAKWAGRFVSDVAKNAATSWLSNPFARSRRQPDPYRAQAWTNGNEFARIIDADVSRKAIGR